MLCLGTYQGAFLGGERGETQLSQLKMQILPHENLIFHSENRQQKTFFPEEEGEKA